MAQSDKFMDVVENFMRLTNEFNQIQKLPITFPNHVTLSTAAIHLVEAIEKHPFSNVTTLAEILGITKGAISQQIPRLEKNGLITKFQSEGNRKEVFFSLTELGKETFAYHEKLHQGLYADLANDLKMLSVADLEIVNDILARLSRSIKTYQSELGHH